MGVFALIITWLQFQFLYGFVDVKLSTAFENVTRNLFELETRMFINNYGVDSETITRMLLKGLNERAMPFQLTNKKLGQKILMDSSALVIFDSFGKLRTFNDKLILTNKFYKPLQLFLFCQRASVKQIESLIVDVARRHKYSKRLCSVGVFGINDAQIPTVLHERTALTDVINFEYFLVNEGRFIKLLTFIWYSAAECGKLQLIEINRFSMKTATWENNNFSIEKLANFHDCEIVHDIVEFEPFTTFLYSMPREFANNLNFKLRAASNLEEVIAKNILMYKRFNVTVDFYFHKACYDSFHYMGNFFNILDPTAGERKTKKVDYFITWPVYYPKTFLAAPVSENYSEYEKLVMPFDVYTWFLIAFTFVLAFVTILILYCVRQSTRDLVIGSNVNTPSLNILRIFFGITINILPRRNFARFLAMSFMLYCLIIRTAWQGKMFEFMAKDVPKPEIKTTEEMIEGGYDFYMEPNFKEMYPESKIAKRGKVKSSEDYLNFIHAIISGEKRFLDSSYKGVLQISRHQTLVLNKANGIGFFRRLREEVITNKMCGFAFMTHHHFTGIFDLKSQQMFTAGIVFHTRGRSRDFEYLWKDYKYLFKLPPDPPKALNLKKLEPGFGIFSACLLFSLSVLFLELLIKLCKYKQQFRVANLALKAVKVAISVVPEIKDAAIECEEYIVMNWTDERMTSEAVECIFESGEVKRGPSEEAEMATENLDVEAYKSALKSINRRNSIDDIIESFEIQSEIVEQSRIEVENRKKNRRDFTHELLEGFEIRADCFEPENNSENLTNSINNAIDDLLEDLETYEETLKRIITNKK